MLRSSLALLGIVCALGLSAQTPSQRETVLVSATVSTSPASITLNWSAFSGSTGFTVYRKPKSGTSWTSIGTAAGTATQYADNTAVAGEYYEYKVVRTANAGTGYGYIAAGIQVPVVDFRGKMVLLVDNTFTSSLSTQLTQLVNDLRADGWVVLRHDVDRFASTSSIRSIVQSDYNADPANVKSVFVFGHVPVPYSGQLNPDGHGDHLGAWPADGYYGEMNGTWTDNSVNITSGQSSRNHNVPGDGKFDQSTYPSDVELQVGRVDLSDMESFQYYQGLNEQALLGNYLTKLHNYKIKQFTPQFRGAVFDNFEDVGNALAASGYRSVSANVGPANMSDLNGNGSPFSSYINGQSYLWTFSCGGGTWTSASNVCSTGEYAQNVSMGGVFNMCMGSYFGDWDIMNNFLRAPLCSGNGLTNAYAGLPYWWFHHMGMGDPIGYSTMVSMNNGSIYSPANSGWQGGNTNRVHMCLMGDPSLRQVMVNMPSNLSVTNSGGLANFTWTAASGSPAGYHIYDMGASATSTPVRVTTSMVTGTSFSSPTVPFISGRQYMVRAVKLETSATGTYYNMSLGAFGTASGTASPDCLGVVGGPATIGSNCNDNNACTTNDVYNASCVCAGTNSGDSDGDGVCNASDNCPNVAGQQGSSCNDNNACTINDVLNAGCQCVGTNSPDSDGDGICNTQDNCPSIAGQQGSSCSDGNACTINDVLNASCQCVGTTSPDSDGDGICNATDNCPNVSGQIGSSCNDGNACTTNDVLNSSCQCAGTASADSDGDGICNAQDNCPNTFGQIGSSCNDGNGCTTNDVVNSNCQCAGTTSDTDGDGICDGQDNCPTVPGVIGYACNDNNACTTNDVLNASCQCAGTFQDTDSDGICNANDNCPNVTGQIGSTCNDGNSQTVNDALNASCQCVGTTVDCNDNNPCTADSFSGGCVHTPLPDSDGDGACDPVDGCPNDVNKTAPGICGCGVNDADSDGDGTANCNDGCPNDANKTSPGTCGCGVSDADSDGDGTANCNDGCPNDANKTSPGTCGCGVSDSDTDFDGTADCNDGCPIDPNKTSPGVCGCGVPEGTCIDCAGVLNGTAAVDQCGVCAGGTTGIIPNESCLDCAGVPNGAAAVDQCGVCAGGNTGITPNNSCADCLGAPNGSALPGSACDDNNANTANDTWTAGCACEGMMMDCLGVPGGTTLPGTACDDGDSGTENDVYGADCVCAGTAIPVDCNGDMNGTATVDACGVCAGGNTGIIPNSTCLDCNGEVNGSAFTDNCGTCVGGGTGLTACSQDCLGNWGGSVLPGSACDDNDAGTENDTYGADCICAGTAIPVDCNGDSNGTAGIDACGVCAGGNTGIIPNSTCLDCNGEVNGSAFTDNCGTCVGGGTGLSACSQDCVGNWGGSTLPGSACDDNDAGTQNDVYGADCVCAGTPIPVDCNGDANGTAGIDACGVCAGGNTGVIPNSTCLDCLGTPNGSALPGTACDDNNANTGNDTWTFGCTCEGTLIDCEGAIGGAALPGTICDDGNAGTANDIWGAGCVCTGDLLDCIGVPGGDALPGTACDDGAPSTVNDAWSSNCICVGESLDCEGTPGGDALPGTACDDGNASTGDDHWTANCACIGYLLDCEGVPGGNALVGTGCSDGDIDTENDLYGADCVCAGTPIPYDCIGVAHGTALPGTSCDDGDFGTGNDVWTSNCLCVGQLIDCVGVIGGGELPGTSCDDNNPNTGNDTWNGNCGCVGQMIDCEGVIGGTALPGMACDDGINGNGVDLWTIDCNCVGNSNTMDCEGTMNGPAMPGTPCDDGNAGTGNDTWNISCSCTGVPIDCAGVIGGTAAIDDCGTCAGGTTGVVANPDEDQDGALDCADNCLGLANGEQADFDGDNVGDLCDNCAWVANPGQEDSNGNGIGDLCEEIGMAENSTTAFNVFPNPTNGHVVITCGDASVRTIQYFDLSGKLIYSAPFAIRSDVSALAMGSYVVIALDAEGRPLARTKLVKN